MSIYKRLSLVLLFMLTLLWLNQPTWMAAQAAIQPQPGPDADGDWLSAVDETKFGSDPEQIDTDGDGMTNFEEIYILREIVLLRNYENASLEEVLTRFVNKITPQHKGQLVELNFDDRLALLWRNNSQQDTAWVAFRALDQTGNLVHISTALRELAKVEAQFLAFAQTVDFQAPSRQLDSIEQSVSQYLIR
jgi:hypothetical protein